MDRNRKQNFILLGLAVLAVGAVIFLVTRGPEKTTNDVATGTMVYDPISKTSENIVINYDGSHEPNYDAGHGDYSIFALENLPLDVGTKEVLYNDLPRYIRSYVLPSAGSTYIHVAEDSIKETTKGFYSFRVYVDNPETYFNVETLDTSTADTLAVTQIPWEGIP